MSAGLEPPRHVFAHGWWTVEGQKMSKSLGNVVSPASLIEKYGLDQTRYFLLREIAFGSDGDFSHAAMVRRINHDLANDYGNLAQRVLSMIAKNCGGRVPEPGHLTDADEALLEAAQALLPRTRACMAEIAAHKALELLWEVCGAANRYVDAQAPWTLRKTDPARMATVLWVLAETVRRLAILTQPFMPDASAKLLDLLTVPADERGFASLDAALRPGSALPPPAGVFPRHVESEAA
jgi:methionyl-tRNA synthetase